MKTIQILIIDLGSQYTLVIARTLRELGIRSIVLNPKKAAGWLEDNRPRGIILSGGSASVYEDGSPSPPEEIINMGLPILGICYGMQWLAQKLGGSVAADRAAKEYGATEVLFDNTDPLLKNIESRSTVWASHGDSVERLPVGFKKIAESAHAQTIAAMSDTARKMWALQFHPEVTQTEKGKGILSSFLFKICGCEKDWLPQGIIAGIKKEAARIIKDERAVIGFSGGVDSTTLTAILSPILNSNLLAVCLNTGALRKDELEEIQENAGHAAADLKIIEAAQRFQETALTATNAETKRAHFKQLYRQLLEEAAKGFGARFIIQGSLATDFIESGGTGQADLIKSHHNIGLNSDFKEWHPFRHLFKYEVRALAAEIGLPESITSRHPFPGPGLFIRVIGSAPTPDKLSIVRWADAEVTKIIRAHNLYEEISQLVVALDCTPTVGIKGDARAYSFSIIVRAVKTIDFMTAAGYQFPASVRRKITTKITKHPQIVRVFFDETSKPPATIEMQ